MKSADYLQEQCKCFVSNHAIEVDLKAFESDELRNCGNFFKTHSVFLSIYFISKYFRIPLMFPRMFLLCVGHDYLQLMT